MKRRDFLKLSTSGLFLGASAPEFVFAEDEINSSALNEALVKNSGFSVLQGLTTESSTQLTVDVPKSMVVRYRLIDRETRQEIPTAYERTEIRNHSSWRVDKLGFEGLRYPGSYAFQILDRKGALIEERYLKTLDLKRTNVRIGLLSCMLDWSLTKAVMWDSVQKAKPDMLFFLGDNVYGDLGLKRGPSLLWKRYIETRRRIPFYHFKELIPTVATWDDHDFGVNDAGWKYKHKEDSAATFKAFFAQESVRNIFENGPGISSVFHAFGQQFIFSDNRSFRRAPSPIHDKSFWGDDQLKFAVSRLHPQKGPIWIMQGTQTFGDPKIRETYEHTFESEFAELRQHLRSLNVPVIFTSGDIHFTEIAKIESDFLGFPTYEITSSSLHSFLPMGRPKNARRTHAVFGQNALMVELSESSSQLDLQVTSIGYYNRVHLKKNLVVG